MVIYYSFVVVYFLNWSKIKSLNDVFVMETLTPGISSLVSLGQYGIVGVILALIMLSGVCVYFLSKAYLQHAEVFGTHIKNTNDIILENTKVLTELRDAIRDLKRDFKS